MQDQRTDSTICLARLVLGPMVVGEEEAGTDRGGESAVHSLERAVASQCLPPTWLCTLAAKIPAGTVRELSDRVWDHISVERVSSKHFSRQPRIALSPNDRKAKNLAWIERVLFAFPAGKTSKNLTL
jgi:hypothetical protein